MKEFFNNTKTYYLNHMTTINYIALTSLYLLACFWGIFLYIGMAVLFAIVLFNPPKTSFSFVIFSIPFCFINTWFGLLAFGFSLLAFFIKHYVIEIVINKRKLSKPALITLGIFFIYSLLHFSAYSKYFLITLSLMLALFILIDFFVMHRDIADFKKNSFIFVMAMMIGLVFSQLWYISPHLQDTMRTWGVSLGSNIHFLRQHVFFGNPNILAVICELMLSVYAIDILKGKAYKKVFITFICLSILGILTFSKTFLLLFSFIIFLMFIFGLVHKNKTSIDLFLILIGAGALFVLIVPEYALSYLNRFFNYENFGKDLEGFKQLLDIITTGRYHIWYSYLEYLLDNPLVLLFGRGLGAIQVGTMSPHNTVLSIIYQMGLVGAALFVFTIFMMVRPKLIEYKKSLPNKTIIFNKLYLIPILIWFLVAMVEDYGFFYIIPRL